jgi:hypothetical protein
MFINGIHSNGWRNERSVAGNFSGCPFDKIIQIHRPQVIAAA